MDTNFVSAIHLEAVVYKEVAENYIYVDMKLVQQKIFSSLTLPEWMIKVTSVITNGMVLVWVTLLPVKIYFRYEISVRNGYRYFRWDPRKTKYPQRLTLKKVKSWLGFSKVFSFFCPLLTLAKYRTLELICCIPPFRWTHHVRVKARSWPE